jgi:hypothetical protein
MISQRFNAQKLLFKAGQEDVFLDRLTVSAAEDQLLRNARAKVRRALRAGFTAIRQRAGQNDELDYIRQLYPKFWTQGSYAYRTMNNPCCTPPQQIDLDDGVYFPMGFVESNPRAASKLLFEVVDGILANLAKREGWQFSDSKDTCVRLEINNRIHVDVPIYAIPEERYAALSESRSINAIATFSMDGFTDYLDPECIYLAKRGNDCWTQSDPMLIHKWFLNAIYTHSERLRRVCRYIKAWRDHAWNDGGGPSSISLMAAVTETFTEYLNSTRKAFETDCQALLIVVNRLPAQFQTGIVNPAEPGTSKQPEMLYPRGQTATEQAEILMNLRTLQSQVESGLCNAQNKTDVVLAFRQAFGERIPFKPELVEPISAADTVRNTPAQKQSKPVMPTTQRSA